MSSAVDALVSVLSSSFLHNAVRRAIDDWLSLISSSRDDVLLGRDISGDNGIVHEGWLGLEREGNPPLVVHTCQEGYQRRNVEGEKIHNYLVSYYIMSLLPESRRTTFTPAIKGHKVTYSDADLAIVNRDVYVDFVLQQFPGDSETTFEDYASFLGRDVARFLYVGMVNVPRHLMPGLYDGLFRTAMIDLDTKDPGTFSWIVNDSERYGSANRAALLEREKSFVSSAASYFLNANLPEGRKFDNDLISRLYVLYNDSFQEEIHELTGHYHDHLSLKNYPKVFSPL